MKLWRYPDEVNITGSTDTVETDHFRASIQRPCEITPFKAVEICYTVFVALYVSQLYVWGWSWTYLYVQLYIKSNKTQNEDTLHFYVIVLQSLKHKCNSVFPCLRLMHCGKISRDSTVIEKINKKMWFTGLELFFKLSNI